MLAPETFYTLFSDSITRNIFDIIAKQRAIRFKDLRQSTHLPIEDTSIRLERLRQANLIEAKRAPLKDFETYYMTANGLSVERELKRQDTSLSNTDGIKVATP